MIEKALIFNFGGICLWERTEGQNKRQLEECVNGLIQDVFLEDKKAALLYGFKNYTVKWKTLNEEKLCFAIIFQKVLPVRYDEKLLKGMLRNWDGDVDFDKKYDAILNACRSGMEEKLASEHKKGAKESNEDTLDEKPTLVPKRVSLDGKKPIKSKNNKKPKKPKKAPRKWDELKYSQDDEKDLDMSADKHLADDAKVDAFKEEFMPDKDVKVDWEFTENTNEKDKKRGWMNSLWSTVVGGELKESDLTSTMDKFRNLLLSKNVATEIADDIINSVSKSLIGKKFSSFSSTYDTVQHAMRDSLTRILTPKRKIDVLREIQKAKTEGRPYTITMVGVNGVGKSTSLAKIVFWLKHQGYSVMIAACDTFRSGAVEQLQTHAKCLDVELYQQGYGKDAAGIAKSAIRSAKEKGIDVVMIDTAGRMQDNKPLMKELAKLIVVNNPDLTLFVGAALTGNDGVHQLITFNTELSYINKGMDRHIDGIVLTKFDTIDDKVGSAISMCYTSGIPIVFVGVGQTYADLKILSPEYLVSLLLKN